MPRRHRNPVSVDRRAFLRSVAGGVAGTALGMDWLLPSAAQSAGREVPHATCPAVPGVGPKRQFRGVWMATVENIDWPSRPGLSAGQQQQELIRRLDAMAALRLNAVIMQVRPAADAFYRSDLAPWSQYLTGTPGKDPGYDPLAFAIREAHARNLELHAWFNPYRVSLGTSLAKLAPNSPARAHPSWVVPYGGRLYFDPGIPGVRALLRESIVDVVARYDVDAIHFDDYFYPYPDGTHPFPDDDSFRRYGGGHYRSKGDWRRHNVNLLVQDVSRAIKATKPWVKFGISPFGLWRNASTDPLGSRTKGYQSYDMIYADSRTWVKSGWLDYVAPQIYWSLTNQVAPYGALVPWWANVVAGTPVHLYTGQAAYMVGSTSSAGWNDQEEMARHLALDRRFGRVQGEVYYNTSSLMRNPLGLADRLKRDAYLHPALVPVMDRLHGAAPHPVSAVSAQRGTGGISLQWQDGSAAGPATYYAIYRFPKGAQLANSCSLDDPRHLLATVRRNGTSLVQRYRDPAAAANQQYSYVVTALDRLHHESTGSQSVTL